MPYTLSHALNPIIREYRRASSTAIDASLKPLMQEYLSTMESDLRAAGFAGHLLIATSFGGAWRPDQVVERPIYSVGSGPSMAPIAALMYAQRRVRRGGRRRPRRLRHRRHDVRRRAHLGRSRQRDGETWLGGRWTGHITGIRSVDVKSIGSGGGSIIWIDPGGLLRVGPLSAGADPGPACYRRGGTEPTVTDAAVVLGWIDPAYFLGGLLALDAEASARVLETIARPLGMSVEEAAYAALTIATRERDRRDPRDHDRAGHRPARVLAGRGRRGLGPERRPDRARARLEAACCCPPTAGALSACGALFSDVISEFSRSRYAETRTLDPDAVNEVLADIEARADAFLADLADIDPVATHKEFTVEARYRAQIWELDVPIPSRIRRRRRGCARGRVPRDARARLRRARAGSVPGVPALEGARDGRAAQACGAPARAPPRAVPSLRSSLLRTSARRDSCRCPTTTASTLPRGARIEGPALIREPTTTVVAYPGSTVTVSALGNYLLEVQP